MFLIPVANASPKGNTAAAMLLISLDTDSGFTSVPIQTQQRFALLSVAVTLDEPETFTPDSFERTMGRATLEVGSQGTQGLLLRMISQRDAQGQHEVAVKHACSAEKRYCLKFKWHLGGQENEKGRGRGGNPQLSLSNLTAGCITSRVSHCELFYFPTIRSSDRSDMRSNYHTLLTVTRLFSMGTN